MIGKVCSAGLLTLLAAAPARAEPLSIEKQGSFFIGGHDVKSDTLSTLPAYAPGLSIAGELIHSQLREVGHSSVRD